MTAAARATVKGAEGTTEIVDNTTVVADTSAREATNVKQPRQGGTRWQDCARGASF
jgi:hypothetical protein